MLRWRRLEVSGGFLLVLAMVYYLDGQNLLPWALLACGCHELGHICALHVLGGRVRRLRLSAMGAELVLAATHPLGHGAQALAALAGPAVNLLLAIFTAQMGERFYLFAGLNLALAAFNLLPVTQLDGGRALAALVALLWSPGAGAGALQALSAATLLCLLLGGGLLLRQGGTGFTLLIGAIWLAAPLIRGKLHISQ
ncbi:MAG: site-2 protease family protein [Pseudoflavonifractor sp.]